MNKLASALGILLIIVAIVYFTLPADQLPSFMPGHEAGVMRTHLKHGMVAAVLGVVLVCVGWFLSRRKA